MSDPEIHHSHPEHRSLLEPHDHLRPHGGPEPADEESDWKVVVGRWPRDVLVVRGPDAVAYLHGQLSADVIALEPGQSTLGLLLEPNGKMNVLVRLWRTDEHVVVIDTDKGAGDAVETRLRRFLLRTDLTIERLEWDCVILRGPGSTRIVGQLDVSGPELVGLGMWPGIEGVDLLGPGLSVTAEHERHDVRAAGPDEIEALRIRAGWPSYGAEVVPGVIPAEVGSWLITAAVSFTKGCYVGQELTTRINSRGGNVPRNLRSIELPAGQTAAPGDDIVVVREDGAPDGDGVGVVSSAALDPLTGTTVALGYVKRSVDEDARLGVSGGDRTD